MSMILRSANAHALVKRWAKSAENVSNIEKNDKYAFIVDKYRKKQSFFDKSDNNMLRYFWYIISLIL